MVLRNITNNAWDTVSDTETFTYQNGQTVDFTYVADGSARTGDNPLGVGAANIGTGSQGGNSASISFDEPVSNLTIAVNEFDGGREKIQFTVDGAVVDLQTLVDAGDVTIMANGFPVSAVNADGELQYGGASGDVVLVIFLIPVSSVTATRTHTVSGYNFVLDAFLDDDPQFAPCFTAGTLIDTDQGPIPVESLKTGDMIRTKDHGFQPVKWVGGSRVHDASVRIKAGTFGNARDLVVSPRHRMLLKGWQVDLMFNQEEVFATAGHLKNGTTITQEPESWVTYYHILLDRHEVIYAEGAETESFFPDAASLNGMAKATREELSQTVDLSTFGRTVRPTLSANQAMYLSHNMDLLEEDADQIASQ